MTEPVTLELLGVLIRRTLDRVDTVLDRIDVVETRLRISDARDARIDTSLATIIDQLHAVNRVLDRQETRIRKLEDHQAP